jgi:hypothetical protein
MKSGDMLARSYDTNYTFGGVHGMTLANGTCDGNGTCTSGAWVNGTTKDGPWFFGRPQGDRVSFNCLGSNYTETAGLEHLNCPGGLRAQVQFQSCWNGKDLYLEDNSHVAYMSQIDNGICPPGYPIQFVHLFYEVLYYINFIDQSKGGRFVFSNGDPTGMFTLLFRNILINLTGYGFHGDFINGWNSNTLEAALDQCANDVTIQGQISLCPPLAVSDTSQASFNCPEQSPRVAEKTHGMLDKLPGCITITEGPDKAPLDSLVCPADAPQPSLNPTPTHSGSYVTFMPVAGKTYDSWTYLGCANETAADQPRALSGPSMVNASMTIELCRSFCSGKGLPLAGLEYSDQCYCGMNIDPSSSFGQNCDPMVCGGNRSEFCGGPSRVSVWNSTLYTGLYQMTPSVIGQEIHTSLGAARYLGCANDDFNTRGRAINVASFANSTVMDIETCISFCAKTRTTLAGMEYGDECYCGNELANGSSVGGSKSCTMSCASNATEYCGGPSALSLWNISAITNTNRGA